MNYLGLDYGEKNIGLAKATSELKIATPFKIIKNSAGVCEELQKIIKTEKIDELVVGYPLTLKGGVGQQAEVVEEFIEKIRIFNLPINRQDERFSSKSAVAGQADNDASAAALILRTYLERL